MATTRRHILSFTCLLVLTLGGTFTYVYILPGHGIHREVKELYLGKISRVNSEAAARNTSASQKKTTLKIGVPALSNRYVVWECRVMCGGWGDRLRGIMSTFAWSVLTGRQFIVDHVAPCDLRKFLQPKPPLKWNHIIPSNTQLTARRFNLIDNHNFLREIQSSKNLSDMYPQDILRFHTNTDMFPGFRYNKDLHKIIREKYGVGFKDFVFEKIFKRQYDTLFDMTPAFKEKFQSVLLKAKPNEKTKLACLQYRQLFQDHGTQLRAWEFLKNITSKFESYKIFVTTDSETIRKEAKATFGDRMIDPDGEISHVDHVPQAQRKNGCQLMEKMLLDWHLLTKCDILIHSRSGFGHQAAMMKEPFEGVYALDFKGTIKELTVPDFKQPGGYMDGLFRNMTE